MIKYACDILDLVGEQELEVNIVLPGDLNNMLYLRSMVVETSRNLLYNQVKHIEVLDEFIATLRIFLEEDDNLRTLYSNVLNENDTLNNYQTINIFML